MKIFFYKYGSICEPDISDSFKRLGFEVIDEDMEIYNKNLLPSQCVETVSKKLIDGQFTFVFTINFFPWLSDLCEIMHLKYISLIVDVCSKRNVEYMSLVERLKFVVKTPVK